jgi:hypothetical protein
VAQLDPATGATKLVNAPISFFYCFTVGGLDIKTLSCEKLSEELVVARHTSHTSAS